MLQIDYRSHDRRAILRWAEQDETTRWLDSIRRLSFDQSDDTESEGPWQLSMPWWNFVAMRPRILELFRGFGLHIGRELSIGREAAELLRQASRIRGTYDTAKDAAGIPEAALRERLAVVGFGRTLSAEQVRNVGRMAALPAAATFSVPGAGKTTEALACFFYKAQADERLLVIAPKNAFAAWDEQIAECMPGRDYIFHRLRGGMDRITRDLADDPRFMLITYQQLARVPDVIAQHCAAHRVHVFLDESHRIKSGMNGQSARAVLNFSHLPVGKLIMSGTPMPQSTEDIIPQFTFLYPEVPASSTDVVDLIRPVYVRTNKAELGLPPITLNTISLPMAPLQAELYRLMKFEVAREAATALNYRSKRAFRTLGRSVARLLQFVSNPALLASEIGFAHADILAAVLAEGDGPKLRFLLRRARELARAGNKVLIWSSFVRNVEYIAERLADLGAVYIHGGVDAGDENDDDTREGKIRLFHDDTNVRVMVANPAAASEGVSLHRVCHHAIYLDRTFNAAHYLQSLDRIHRFGLPPDQATNIEIIACAESVDETVHERLRLKVERMADALNDSSLRIDPIPIDPTDLDDSEDYSAGLMTEDIEALLRDCSREQR
ncbi:DEAD/DEAH box helicase [Nitratidesulfovibrio sp. 1201_IL3209]|uniref:DEAD/DEAH box helicase n=1 Tax=Nitratidesulfovibrio sp. 1201_IL3209 TaxID=3084053 RepID=UPI002FD90373